MSSAQPSPPGPDAASPRRFEERLTAPASYWAIALFFGLSFATAVGFYLGPLVCVVAGVLTALGIAAFLTFVGRVRIVVDEAGLHVGDSVLEWTYIGPITRLDAQGTRRRLGVDADVRAFVVERPYIPTAVEVGVADEADPHPCWIVSTRRPAELSVALARGLGDGEVVDER